MGNGLTDIISHWFSKSVFPDTSRSVGDTDWKSITEIFQTDYNRYYEGSVDLNKVALRGELQGVLLYRIARQQFLKGDASCDSFAALGRWLSGFEIYYSAELGDSFKVNHGIGMVIGARSRVGRMALFHHGTTLGDHNGGRPTLLDNVTVYPGALILGNITIGNNVIVGANAVCLSSIEDNLTVAGIPAKPISK